MMISGYDIFYISLIDNDAISARQCHNSPIMILVRHYHTMIDTQPMMITCYNYFDTK